MIKKYREVDWLSWREIWRCMWRNHTVLYREYRRNKKRWGHYDPHYATNRAKQRTYGKKKQSKKIRMHNELEQYVITYLRLWWTAETISWRRNNHIKKQYPELPSISSASIRRFVESRYGSWLKHDLTQSKLLKHYKKKSILWKRKWGKIKHRIFIDERPDMVWEKKEWGHCEVDFIESVKEDTTVILVVIEKMTRVRRAILLPNKNSNVVQSWLSMIIKKFNLQSMTFDNDNWFAKHYMLWISTYFCHTYSSREKWQVERWNRWYRKFFPKKTILKNISQEHLDLASNYLNSYPLKCLNYLSPHEIYLQISPKVKQKINLVLQ